MSIRNPAGLANHAGLLAALVVFTTLSSMPCQGQEPDSGRKRYPLTKSEVKRTPRFVVEVGEVPDAAKSKAWGEEARTVCEEWFPVLCKFLATEQFTPPEVITLVIKPDLKVPGATSGSTITFSDSYITKHPDDFGMVIHELVHVVQHYPRTNRNAGWLVEGIADYIRYWKYESEKPKGKLGDKASYRDGYSTSAAFLAWMVWKYDRRTVRKLDAALRKGEYQEALFKEITGKELPELWEEYRAEMKRETR
ncbi:MAG: basic secretory protein-like protein [Gemmataceae bacterium]